MNTNVSVARIAAAAALSLFAATASAQAPVRPPYGPEINLETAKKIAAGAAAEAKKNNWNMAVAIVDNHGMLIYYEIADDTQIAAATVAVDKARTSALWRRPSKEFEENVAGGRVAILRLGDITPIEGGLPIVVSGKMVGAIGVSGGTATQDGQVGKAGVDALSK
ncbi:MAG TPA: heme-binding protein [Casimicrobiaceae bacterium]|nr:heme-binding protein [Casimicrobiaceae bacterium]